MLSTEQMGVIETLVIAEIRKLHAPGIRASALADVVHTFALYLAVCSHEVSRTAAYNEGYEQSYEDE